MSIAIEPQVLNASTESPINLNVSTVSNGEINISTALTNEVNISTISNNTATLAAVAYASNYKHLINKPEINNVILEGNLTSKDLNIKEDANFLFTQTTASDTWVIVHNLNKYPSVTVIDSAGNEIVGDTTYDSLNQITLRFRSGFKGTASLN